jgi:putative ABC transport system permease protein
MLLQQVKPGFSSDHILTMRFALPEYKYPKPEQQEDFVARLLKELATVPGVESAAISTNLPLSGTGTSVSFDIVGRPAPTAQDRPMVDFSLATPDFFRTMQIPLLQGRFFTEQDRNGTPPVAIINEAMAKTYWPHENPIGQHLTETLEQNKTPREIVGVVGDVHQNSLSEDPVPALIVPYEQLPYNLVFLLTRTKVDPASMASTIRGALEKIDRDQPVYDIKTMEQVVQDSNNQRSFNMFLLSSFAGLALVLAIVGVYGVIVFSVSQRQQELGIRMALGAMPGDIRKLVLKQGLILTTTGLVIGLGVAWGVTHIMASLLYHISAKDPLVFGGASIMLTLLALLASYAPAQRAARLEPMVVLREK